MWLFHPDPCDKPRELPNRLIAEPFLLDVHRVLRAGGAFVLKTDHPGYYQWALGLLGLPEPTSSEALNERFEVSMNSPDFWKDDPARLHGAGKYFAGEATAFESRSLRKRLPIHYVELRAHAATRVTLASPATLRWALRRPARRGPTSRRLGLGTAS